MQEIVKVSAEKFKSVFAEVWRQMYEPSRGEFNALYSQPTNWTNLMTGSDGVLHKVMSFMNDERGIPMIYKNEWYTVDALFVCSETTAYTNPSFPAQIYALVEHENGDDVEVEMWKLIFWRAPLKVIIFYDWNKDDRKSEIRQSWLKDKIRFMTGMLEEANNFHPESSGTEYLFIVGAREHKENGDIYWRWASPEHPGPERFA